jgi:hypothetical protein
MRRGEERTIEKDIAQNAFFHDFLLFLQEAARDPYRLTERGNLRLYDIHYLGDRFHLHIYRDIFGARGQYIRSEKDVPMLRRIRLIAGLMGLTEMDAEKKRLSLSQAGKAFLDTLSLQARFEQVILWYLHRYEWADWYDWCAGIASVLQQEQHFIWSYLLSRQNTRIVFAQFLSGLREYFRLDDLVDDPPDYKVTVRWAVEQMLIKDLRLFGLLAVENGERLRFSDDETIAALQPTVLGVHIFTLALTESGATRTTREGERSVS